MPKIHEERPKAVGAYVFAGGFTLGVKEYFDVLTHLEDGKFGAETVRLNFPGLEVHQDPESWPLDRCQGVDLVYCNPPCSPWSTAGIVRGQTTEEQTDWRAHAATGCVARCFSLLARLRPKVWCFESVRQVYTRGGSMLDEMAAEATALGYAVTDLFVEARHHGVPQHRKRYFMVVHRVMVDWRPPDLDEVTVDDALSRVSEEGDHVGAIPRSVAAVCHLVGQGENARMAWDRAREGGVAKDLGTRPAFIYDRMAADRPSYTILGSCNKVHPHEDRMLSVNESAALCGFPSTFRFVGKPGDRYAQVGKGVCPPVAAWLAESLRRAVIGDAPAEVKREAFTVVKGLIQEGIGVVDKKKKFVAPGKRPGNLDRRFDKTQLRSGAYGYTVHRDYAAHYFKWGFMFKKITYQETRVLDVGCGQDCPLARVLSFRLAAVPKLWVGVDLNRIPKPFNSAWARVHDQFNFVDDHERLVKEYDHGFDVAVCFEMIEHMHVPDGRKLLMNFANLVRPKGELVLSTPVYNGKKMAANHIHEYGIDELRELIESTGKWRVTGRYGTFASWNEIKKVMTEPELALYEELNLYYDHEVLSCFMAPKYPDASRNNVWVLRRR